MRRFSPSLFTRTTWLGILASASLLGSACGSKTGDSNKPQQVKTTSEAPASPPPVAPAVSGEAEENPVLVTIGKTELRASDFEGLFEQLRTQKITGRDVEALLERQVAYRLLVEKAKADGYNPGPEYKESAPEAAALVLLTERFGADAKAKVDDSAIEAYFGETRTFRQLRVRSEEMLQPLFENLKEATTTEERLTVFKDVATRMTPRRASTAGEVEPKTVNVKGLDMKGKQVLPPESVKALFNLTEVGSVTELVRLERGRAVYQLLEIKPSKKLDEITSEERDEALKVLTAANLLDVAGPQLKELVAASNVTFNRDAIRKQIMKTVPFRPVRHDIRQRSGAEEGSKDPRMNTMRPNKGVMLERGRFTKDLKHPKAPTEVSQ